MVSPNNISNFTVSRFNGNAILLNTAFKGCYGIANSLKPYGVQLVEPLFHSFTLTPLLTIK
jgi:hypothetical protein